MAKYECRVDLDAIEAIDIHTHAEISGRQPRDPCSILFDEQMAKYFTTMTRPTFVGFSKSTCHHAALSLAVSVPQ